MMNGFFVSITNNLLEDKHFERMGTSVWLFMWLIDRMTEISEGQGIVNNGHPISYEMVQKNFTTMSERTYHRMIATLRDAGYINTMKAKYGLYITINKPKKQFNKRASSPAKNVATEAPRPAKNGRTKTSRPAKNGRTKTSRPAKNGNEDLPNMAGSPAKNGNSLYISTNTNTNTNNNTIKGDKKSPAKNEHKENVSKLYYEAIKALDLPVRNHNTVKAKIAELARDADREKIINYLMFMRDQYATLEWEYKPHISEALDIFAKRGTIRNTFKQHVTASKEESTVWRPKNRGAR